MEEYPPYPYTKEEIELLWEAAGIPIEDLQDMKENEEMELTRVMAFYSEGK